MANEEAEGYKEKGNGLFKEGKYDEAKKLYNKAIQLEPENAAYYSNRSACWSKIGNHESALADANRCIQKDAKFVKGYSRKAKAYFDQGDFNNAEAAYKEGLTIEPGNKACTDGLAEIKAAKGRKGGSSGSRSGGGGGGMASGGIQGMIQQVVEKLKSGGRMQTYAIVMVCYFGFTQLTARNKAPTTTTDDPTVTSRPMDSAEDDEMVQVTAGPISRRFKDLDGQWLSYMQADAKSDTALLMLHRTSLSAEAEFSTFFPKLQKVVGGTARIVAPDRPCHGFTPCPESGEPEDASSWLKPLVKIGGAPERIAVVAIGKEAALQALLLASKRKEVMHILLISPKVAAPLRERMTKTDELHAWLKTNGYPATGQAAADAIRWAASGVTGKAKPRPLTALVEKLPQDCRVTLLYDAGEEEDDELKQALDAQGTEVKSRSTSGKDSLFDILADEVQQSLNPESVEAES